MMRYPKISIITPAYNESEIIEKTMKHLVNELKYPSRKKEIIIGIDGCTDNTLDIVKKFIKENRKKCVIKIDCDGKRRGMAGRMMSMLKKAKGEIVLKMDADMRLHSPGNVLYKIADAFKDPNVGGIVWFGEDFSKTLQAERSFIARGEIFANMLVSEFRKQFYPLTTIPPVPTLSVQCFRRKLINPNIDASKIICMDDEIGYMILKKKYKIIYLGDVSVYFYGVPITVQQLFYQKRRGISGWFKLSEKYDIRVIGYYSRIFYFFLKNISKYKIEDIISFFYWCVIFTFAMIDAKIKKNYSVTKIWVKTPRKLK